jgi:hypothetical protein
VVIRSGWYESARSLHQNCIGNALFRYMTQSGEKCSAFFILSPKGDSGKSQKYNNVWKIGDIAAVNGLAKALRVVYDKNVFI